MAIFHCYVSSPEGSGKEKNRPEGKAESGKSSFFRRERIVVKHGKANHESSPILLYHKWIKWLDSNHPQML